MSSTIAYTDEQRAAIKARKVSLSLDAGAGCGKTFVLTERFIAELESGGDVNANARLSQLVAITFTDAAARELRTRIRKLVLTKIKEAPPGDRDQWLQLGRAMDACRISTIHSLCGTLLRENAFDVGLDPVFATLDGAAAAVLEAEAIEDTLRELLAVRDPAVMAIATAWGIEGVKSAVTGLISHYRKPAFAEWLDREPGDLLAAWQKYYDDEVWPVAAATLVPLCQELAGLLAAFQPKTADVEAIKFELAEALQAVANSRPSALQLDSIEELARVRTESNAPRKIPFLKSNWPNGDMHAQFTETARCVREAIKKLPKVDFGSDSVQQAAELGLAAARVAKAAAENYQRMKDQHGALDFDDLLAKTHELLTDPRHRDVQGRLQEGIGVLFVDEFQDTDRVQVDMVRALVGDLVESGKLFIVGDDKQSIYRFRGAEPGVFVELRGQIDPAWQLPLSKNFRSQPAILDFVNALFDRVFDKYQPLTANRQQATPEPAVELLWTEFPKPDGSKAGYVAAARAAEARALAVRLRELFDAGPPIVADKDAAGGCRRAKPGDVAILFRVLSDVAYYEEALRGAGIDYYLVGGHAFYTQQEIYDILHLLRVVASECDELSLAGVLRSPLFALADETLFWLGVSGKSLERGLFANSPPGNIDASELAKVRAAADVIGELREKKHTLSVPQLLSLAIERTGYDAALLADFMGERKLANVYKLVEQARTAVATGVGTLDDFVTQLATFTTSIPKEALATTSPGTADVVRLMTVHKSKGLEFPVVVVPDLNRKKQSNQSQVAFDDRVGPLVKPSKDASDGACGLKLYKHVDARAEDEESDRLFYVACTRAADYLLLSSSVDTLESVEGPWLKRLAESFDLASGQLVDSGATASPQVLARMIKPPNPVQQSGGRSTDWLKMLEKAKRVPVDPAVERSAAMIESAPAARRRFSVTRLSGRIIPVGGDWWRDDPDREAEHPTDEVDPLGFGTLVHAVLERVDLNDPSTIATWAKALAPQHDVLHAHAAQVKAGELIGRFFSSSRAEELRRASAVHHETEFTLTWPLGVRDENTRYLQGYLDCLYRGSDGQWRVVDYKTNQVTASAVPAVAAKYELQMLVYGLAVEQTWGVGPAELVLHFLRPGVEHTFPWNTDQRHRAIALVTEAMQHLVSRDAERSE